MQDPGRPNHHAWRQRCRALALGSHATPAVDVVAIADDVTATDALVLFLSAAAR